MKWIDFKDKLPRAFETLLVKICHKDKENLEYPLFFTAFIRINKLYIKTDFFKAQKSCFAVCPTDYSDFDFYWKPMHQVLEEEEHEVD